MMPEVNKFAWLYPSPGNVITTNLEYLPKTIYILKVTTDNFSGSRKLIIN
jgi:hypothetical protein